MCSVYATEELVMGLLTCGKEAYTLSVLALVYRMASEKDKERRITRSLSSCGNLVNGKLVKLIEACSW